MYTSLSDLVHAFVHYLFLLTFIFLSSFLLFVPFFLCLDRFLSCAFDSCDQTSIATKWRRLVYFEVERKVRQLNSWPSLLFRKFSSANISHFRTFPPGQSPPASRMWALTKDSPWFINGLQEHRCGPRWYSARPWQGFCPQETSFSSVPPTTARGD